MMKRVLILLGVIVLIASCEKKEQEVPVSSVSITQATAEMIIGETIQLSATVSPSNATERTISWASSKVSVATVSNGKVTAIAEGSSTITASCGGKSATCQVTVSKGIVAVTSITLNKESISLNKGESETLSATVKPDDATDKTVTWSSSEATVALVDNNGKVTAIAGGNAIITAKAGDKQATCTVTVTVPVESITLDKESLFLEEEESTTLVATVKPDDATEKRVTWSTTDAQIATVDETGKVTAIKEGTVTITAKAENKEAKCDVVIQKNMSNETIQFADENVKAKLVAAFDINGDGELSYGEAAAVSSCNDIKNALGAIKTYNSFDEFQFFTSISSVVQEMFKGWTLLSSIILPKQIREIGESAFASCVNLSSIIIPEGIAELSSGVFYGCRNLTSIILPDGITYIGRSAFYGCTGLTSITIPKSVTSVGENAFYGCTGLTSISIPGSVYSIGGSSFYGCSSLTSLSLSEGVSYIGSTAFKDCSSLASITIPDSILDIKSGAFSGCENLHEVYINSLIGWLNIWLNIKKEALSSHPFYSSGSGRMYLSGIEMKDVSIPECVTSIGNYSFYGCTGLTSITIPENVTNIDMGAFSGCTGLTSISIPESVTSIAWGAFSGCTGLTSISIPESVTSIGQDAFSSCTGLTSITIPESVTIINAYAFSGCTGLTSITIPESVTIIAWGTFSGCTGLTSITIPESISSIAGSIFYNCTGLTSITIPESVTRIDENAFSGCTGLTSITIPESVTSIGKKAFEKCKSVESIIVKAITAPSGGANMFYDTNNCPISVPAESVDAYKTADYWKNYADRIQAIQ